MYVCADHADRTDPISPNMYGSADRRDPIPVKQTVTIVQLTHFLL